MTESIIVATGRGFGSLLDVGYRTIARLFVRNPANQHHTRGPAAPRRATRVQDYQALVVELRTDVQGPSQLVRLTEQSLRRLNNPAALGCTGLAACIPATLDAVTREALGRALQDVTPAERAHAMRSVLVAGIGRLKPLDGNTGIECPAALQYHILREEYVQGLLNKHIMVRHSISEGTFNRNRRQAVAMLAEEIDRQEQLLAREDLDLAVQETLSAAAL